MMNGLAATLTTTILPTVDLPNPTPQAPPGFEKATIVMNWVMWGGIIVLVIALISAWVFFGASKHKGEGNESAVWVGRVIIAAIGVGAAAGLIGFFFK